MGHRIDAIEALRAYARDVEDTINGGVVSSVGGTNQDDAAATRAAHGAAHLLAMSAIAASVVLVGAIATSFVIATSDGSVPAVSAPKPTPSLIASSADSTATAVRALNENGSTQAAQNVLQAMSLGTDATQVVAEALHAVVDRIDVLVASGSSVSATDPALATALENLEEATRPPGLDPDLLAPGQAGTPQGQDPTFVPPGKDPTMAPPGQDPTFVPPGQDTIRGNGNQREVAKP
jgi:hypothetical protein